MGGQGSGRHSLPSEIRADQRKHRALKPEGLFGPKGEPPVPEIIADDELRQAHWRYVCESLSAMGILAESDEGLVTAYVIARVELERTTKLLDDSYGRLARLLEGDEIDFTPTFMRSIAAEQRAARQDVARFASMLGLTPTSRANIPRPPSGPSGESRFDL